MDLGDKGMDNYLINMPADVRWRRELSLVLDRSSLQQGKAHHPEGIDKSSQSGCNRTEGSSHAEGITCSDTAVKQFETYWKSPYHRKSSRPMLARNAEGICFKTTSIKRYRQRSHLFFPDCLPSV